MTMRIRTARWAVLALTPLALLSATSASAQMDPADGDVYANGPVSAPWAVEQDPLADDIAANVYSTNPAVNAINAEGAYDDAAWAGDRYYDPMDADDLPF